ncbi:MAG: DUF4384 domain-containing protein [Acidobacteriota bacterium]
MISWKLTLAKIISIGLLLFTLVALPVQLTAQPAKPRTTTEPVSVNIKYIRNNQHKAVVLQQKGKWPDIAAKNSTWLRAGDQLSISVQSPQDAYLYVLTRLASGKEGVLFPTSALEKPNLFAARKLTLLPLNIVLPAGEERLLFIISPQPNHRLNTAMEVATATKTRSLSEEDVISTELSTAISHWTANEGRDLSAGRPEITALPDAVNPTVRILLTLVHD